jgi:alginate O-acetyltransferase complex protein AlgI
VFTQENLNRLLEMVGQPTFSILKIAFPIGISFYTFHSMSYVIDVYRGERPVRSFADFSCFVSLFPQLVAGPILRYNVLSAQLHSRTHTLDLFARGVLLFFVGFAMKILLANPVGRVADAVFAAQSPDALAAWWGVLAYAFQIYFDFNGYSVMALGLGMMFGFELIRNFNAPYHADSITDFWRRWHISLSTWLREYLYISLGGNRKGERRTYINLALVMLLGGFWHGSEWQFIVWGAIHGAMLGVERWAGKKPFYGNLPRPVRVGITFFVVLITWVFFRADGLPHAFQYLACMFGGGHPNAFAPLLASEIYRLPNFLDMAVCAVLIVQPLQSYEFGRTLTWGKSAAAFGAFLLAVVMMYTQAFNPFLYFQF